MRLSVIDFSAQFGGRDAAAAVLPHFKSLKAAARGLPLEGFPFPKLAYILRVDGEVQRFGFSGARNLEIDSEAEYLSVDIGISQEDRGRIPDVISDAVMASIDTIGTAAATSSWNVDPGALQRSLVDLLARYQEEQVGRSAGNVPDDPEGTDQPMQDDKDRNPSELGH